jgi:hypothetical protein
MEVHMKPFKVMILAMCLAGLGLAGCETSHEESDKTTMFGGHKHEETTVTKNPVTGDTTVTHKEQTTPPP